MILVDTAATGEISAALENPAVSGFTTNPKLIAQAAGQDIISAGDYRSFCEKLCRFAGAEQRVRHLMIQTIGSTSQTLELAGACQEQLAAAGSVSSSKALWIKLPPGIEDLRCIEELRRTGCKTLVTAVFTPSQALMAMESGADGIAVYFGRLMKNDVEWDRRLKTIVEIVRATNALLLLASLSKPALVAQSLEYSMDITVPPALIPGLMHAPLSQAAMEEFAGFVETD